jgi:hypothetical protein
MAVIILVYRQDIHCVFNLRLCTGGHSFHALVGFYMYMYTNIIFIVNLKTYL